jgi:hypothetical protein
MPTYLHRPSGELETIEMLHGLLGVLGFVVDYEAVALGPIRLRVFHQLDRLDPTERLKNAWKQLSAIYAQE